MAAEEQLSSLSRETEHLTTLRRQLAELTGVSSFVNELLQNADDAKAEICRFIIDEHAISVWNDAEFTTCGHLEDKNCPWFLSGAHRCDFHSFRNLGAGDKQSRSGVTGAFGVGFTAVYQYTDNPELISANQHWVLNDLADVGDRIARLKVSDTVGTEFVLPWAYEQSAMRTALARPAVERSFPGVFLREVEAHIPLALIFLRNLQTVELVNDDTTITFTRERRDDEVMITGPHGATTWHMLRGDASERVRLVRQSDQGLRLHDRPTIVEIALTAEETTGRLYATLPTDDRTGFAAHINASFFPRSDRKGVFFDPSRSAYPDLQVRWNRALLQTAAVTLAEHLEEFAGLLGSQATWQILADARTLASMPEGRSVDEVFAAFFDCLKKEVASARITPDTSGELVQTSSLLVPNDEAIYECGLAIDALGLHVVHPDLRSVVILARVAEYGVSNLTLERATAALESLALTEYNPPEELKPIVSDADQYFPLLRLLSVLVEQGASATSLDQLMKLHILPSLDGGRDRGEVSRRLTSRQRQQLGTILDESFGLLDESLLDEAGASPLASLLRFVSPADLIDASQEFADRLELALASGTPAVADLFDFLADNREATLSVKTELANLSIFPTAGTHRPLTTLSLPGGFTDPLGIAGLVDIDAIGGHRDLLHQLGATELDLLTYVRHHVPAYMDADELDSDTVSALRELLATHLGKIEDDESLRDVIQALRLVETEEDDFRPGSATYWPNELIDGVLGNIAVRALPPSSPSVSSLYRYLGVREQPTLADIAMRCRQLAAEDPTPAAIETVGVIVRHLGERYSGNPTPGELDKLRIHLGGFAWLPQEGNPPAWRAPQELDAAFNRNVFETSGRFLALPLRLQQSASTVLQTLGVSSSPTGDQVVAHLLNLSEARQAVPEAVYTWLNQSASDPAVVKLRGRHCLYTDGMGHARPSDVFWSPHPFGSLRYLLPETMRRWEPLLTALGVRDRPEWTDAAAVLTELADRWGHDSPDEPARAVVQSCWRFLSEALDDDEVTPEQLRQLGPLNTVPDGRGLLSAPQRLYFDNMPHLAEHLSELRHLLIRRPADAWRAMEAAGVTSLTNAVVIRIADLEEPETDDVLAEYIRGRDGQLRRLIETHDGDRSDRLAEVLAEIDVTRTTRIRVSLEVLGIGSASTTPAVDAVMVGGHLYVAPIDGDLPWAAIARELERAIDPDSEPGQLSFGIRTVLSARSVEAADRELDTIGVARLDTEQLPDPEAVEVPSLGATETGVDVHIGTAEDTEWTAHDVDERRDTRDPLHRPGAAFDGPGTRGGRPGSASADGSARSPHRSTSKRNRGAGEFVARSYVQPESDDETALDADNKLKRITETKAVEAAMAFERGQGRFPTEMPPNNPGFDIESRDADGTIVRWIEVKGLSASWGTQPAELTKTEYEEAAVRGDQYFLYVVDDARADELRVLYVLRNPVGRIGRYLFDGGWRAIAEVAWQNLPDLPEINYLKQPSEGSRPFYAPGRTPADGEPDGHVSIAHRWSTDAAWVSQIHNLVRGPQSYGWLILVEPVDDDYPLDGEFVYVDLSGLERRLSCGTLTYARWLEEEDGVVLDLGPLGDEPLSDAEAGLVAVLGKARPLNPGGRAF